MPPPKNECNGVHPVKILITGSEGFLGKNLSVYLSERKDIEILTFNRNSSPADLPGLVAQAEFVFHLAGVNRPPQEEGFQENFDITASLARALESAGRKVPVLYTSSTQAAQDNPYGHSKRAAEEALLALRQDGFPVHIYRLPNVFGKWARPNYNSAVATFCHNIARDLPIRINNAEAQITLVYVDDVVDDFVAVMEGKKSGTPFAEISPQYRITVGELAAQLEKFRDSRHSLTTEPVGSGLVRALYSTYVSYLPPEKFDYQVPRHADQRGVFVEMLKTWDSGQFSFFTAHPGITRGGHYHHSKTEKFLVIKGKACFRFRHILSGEFYELFVSGEESRIVETVPGWTHDITNVGDDEIVVMLWANEIFDREKPDTYALPVGTAP